MCTVRHTRLVEDLLAIVKDRVAGQGPVVELGAEVVRRHRQEYVVVSAVVGPLCMSLTLVGLRVKLDTDAMVGVETRHTQEMAQSGAKRVA